MTKTLLLDIETAPSKAYIWSLWKEVMSMEFIEEDWFILCWAAKWLGEKEIFSSALIDFKSYKKEPENDKQVVKAIWKLLNEADIVIAHNGIKFDIKKLNTRFLMHGMLPPAPYKVVDTLNIARGTFAFMSNRLNDLGQFLNLGKKIDTGGFALWRDCLNGIKSAWLKMIKYNKNDVVLLEKIYLSLRPYAKRLPNISIYENREDLTCTKCGSDNIYMRGYYYTNVSKFRRYSCKDCGSWCRARKKEKMHDTAVNAV